MQASDNLESIDDQSADDLAELVLDTAAAVVEIVRERDPEIVTEAELRLMDGNR